MTRLLLFLALAVSASAQPFTINDPAFLGQARIGGILSGLQAAWNFDEQFNGPTNRFSDFGSQVFTNVGALTGSERTLTSGGVNITNSGAGYLNLTNTSMFGLNSSFTMAFWTVGGTSGGADTSIGQHISNATYDYLWDTQNFTITDSGGTPRQVIGTASSVGAWMLTVCGYDSANSQVFISNNGGARVNAACGSVKQTANMPMKISVNPMVVDNFYFWNRVLTTAEITQLYNSGRGQQYPFVNTPGAQTAYAWAWTVTNLSGTVTSNSISAMTTLIDAFNTAGILGRATCIVPFCPDSLQAALTSPLNAWGINGGNSFIAPTILPYEGNSGFNSGDLSENGLTGNPGGSKYVGLFPAPNDPAGGLRKIMPNPLDAGKILYAYTANSGVYVEEGYYDNGISPNQNSITTIAYNSAPFNRHRLGDLGSTAGTNVSLTGFYSQQRVNSTELDVYFANPVNPHFLYLQDTTTSGVSSWRVNFINYALFNYWDAAGGGPSGGNYTANTLSFFATFSAHLTSSESADAYAAVNAYRLASGGGVSIPFSTVPSNSVVLIGNNKTLVSATTGGATYQWQKNGVDIGGATSSSYTVSGAALSDFGTYRAVGTISGVHYPTPGIQLATVTTTTVSNWVVQCGVNGASTLSSNTIWAIDRFWNGTITDGNDTAMKMVNCFVPDNLSACLTPLVAGAGNKLWVNSGPFVSADLTVNGLIGNGSKYLDTGWDANANLASSDDAGLTIYSYTATSGAYRYIGSYLISGNRGYLINVNSSDTANPAAGMIGDDGFQAGVSPSPGAGYYSANRTSSVRQDLYFANSGNAHSSVAHNTSTRTVAVPTGNITVFAINVPGFNAHYEPTVDRLSFASTHTSLSSGGSGNQYSRVQSLRTALGGGYQ